MLIFWRRRSIHRLSHAFKLPAVNYQDAFNDLRIQILSMFLERVVTAGQSSGHNAPHVPGKGGVESNMGVMSISYFF